MGEIKFDVWPMSEEQLLAEESMLSVANGYVGMRGNFEEGYQEGVNSIRGTYINGFYDQSLDVQEVYGYPIGSQEIVNVIDVQGIELWIENDRFSLFEGLVLAYHRSLDIEQGLMKRTVLWQSPKGHKVEVVVTRMASFEMLELVTMDYEVRSLNFNGEVTLVSVMDGNVTNDDLNDLSVERNHSNKHLKITEIRENNNVAIMQGRTLGSNLSTSTAVGHSLEMAYEIHGLTIKAIYKGNIKKNQSIRLIKYAIFTDSRRHGHSSAVAMAYVNEAMDHGIDQWYKAQKDYLSHFWRYSKVEIQGNDEVEKRLNYSIYQLLASAGKDGYSSVSSKGLTGEGYGGHYFWDTEIYMLPFFTLTNPEMAKDLLMFRYKSLEASRCRAKELGHQSGAKIAWRTISGEESTSDYYTDIAHYHINADVAYSISEYWHMTGDNAFMEAYGAEVMVETARLWLDLGNYDNKGRFVINGVTGPDMYSTLVNNNYYTNAMAKWHLAEVGLVLKALETYNSSGYGSLIKKMHISEKELMAMAHASTAMYLPYSEGLGVDLQDDSFEQKAPWDFANTPANNFPLADHYHPLTLSRHKVLRQADTVLAHLLLGRDIEVMGKTFDYYEPYTTHDSSLSYCIYGMMASRLGKADKAYYYLMKTLYLDFDNLQHDTNEGLHLANAGGAYMSLVYGFAGFRQRGGQVHFRPTLPKGWDGYAFNISFRQTLIGLRVSKDGISVQSKDAIEVVIDDVVHQVEGTLRIHKKL